MHYWRVERSCEDCFMLSGVVGVASTCAVGCVLSSVVFRLTRGLRLTFSRYMRVRLLYLATVFFSFSNLP